MNPKNIDELMQHLRKNGISISGDMQKRQLLNTGYFHGYKGYRFFKNSNRKLPYTSYDEVYATIDYDSKLKALLYPKMMYIETAVKNIALNCILEAINSSSLQDMYDNIVASYNNAPSNSTLEQKKRLQQDKLSLQNTIQANLLRAYKKGNPKITHFYNNIGYSEVPIWALFEILTMGDFGYLLSCLTFDIRDKISLQLGLNTSADTNRELVFKYIYTLKDLRNAIAHNSVVFDTRFRNIDITRAMEQCLKIDIHLPYVNFKTIGDYIILLCYYLKLLKVSETEIKSFIDEVEKIMTNYKLSVGKQISSIVIHTDTHARLGILRKFI